MKKIIKIIIVFLAVFWAVGQIQVITDILEDIKTAQQQPHAQKRALNHIDTPEEMPEVSYNTYYLLTWHSSNGSFIAAGSLDYSLDTAWSFDNLASDTLFISTHDNDIFTLQQFKETYIERDILLNRSVDLTMIVPYIATYLNGVQENYNILISLNTFLYNTDYRNLYIYNNVGTYTINTFWSIQNADNSIDNEYIIQWGQPMLLLQSDTFTHRLQETLTLQAFIQPISIKFSNASVLELKYLEGYNNGYAVGKNDGFSLGAEDMKNKLTGLPLFIETLKITQLFLDIKLYNDITFGTLIGGVLIIGIVFWFINLWR